MTITSDLEAIKASYYQNRLALRYRNVFKDIFDRIDHLDKEIDEVVQTSQFTAIPTSIKQALNAYRQLLKTFKADVLIDDNIVELLGMIEEPPLEPPPV